MEKDGYHCSMEAIHMIESKKKTYSALLDKD